MGYLVSIHTNYLSVLDIQSLQGLGPCQQYYNKLARASKRGDPKVGYNQIHAPPERAFGRWWKETLQLLGHFSQAGLQPYHNLKHQK